MNKYLKQLLDALTAKNLELQGHMTKSLDGGSTPDEETEGKIQAVEKDIDAIEKNIERVKKQIEAAKHAEETGIEPNGENEEGAKDQDGKKKKSVITIESNLPKGVGFAQYARAKLCAQLDAKEGRYTSPLEKAKQLGFNEEVQDLITKATLGTTTDGGFAASLVTENRLVGEFVEMLRAATVFDQLSGFRAVCGLGLRTAGPARCTTTTVAHPSPAARHHHGAMDGLPTANGDSRLHRLGHHRCAGENGDPVHLRRFTRRDSAAAYSAVHRRRCRHAACMSLATTARQCFGSCRCGTTSSPRREHWPLGLPERTRPMGDRAAVSRGAPVPPWLCRCRWRLP